MSNMYTILDSLKKVTPQQEPLENKKPQAIYESVEAKGSILEGVAKVEQKLKEQFAKFNEGDTEYKNGVTKHKGTYGTEYQGDADDEDAPKRGRPAKGTARKEKVVRVKGPKGRPKKDPAPTYSKSNDPFGRVPDKAPKGAKGTVVKGKDTVDEAQLDELSPKTLGNYVKDAAYDAKGKGFDAGSQQGWAMSKSKEMFGGVEAGADTDEKAHKRLRGIKRATDKLVAKTTEGAKNPYAIGMAQAKKETGLGKATARNLPKSTIKRAHHIGDTIKANEGRNSRLANMLLEGVNFTEMIKKKDLTLQEMLAELQNDIQQFKETGHCSELLRDCMEVHSFNKQQLNDATENPMDNDNDFPAPLTPTQPSMMDRAKRMGSHVLNKLGHGSDEDMKADLRRKMEMQEAAELNELARLAGLTVAEANDGNLANNAKPYNKVTQGDVIAGRLGRDEQGGKEEVDEEQHDLAEGEGNLAKALDTLRGGWSGWHRVDYHDPNIEKYEWDDGEGGFYAGGSVEHNLKTGEITVDYHGEYDDEVKGTFNSIGDAMRALRGGYPADHGGHAPNFDRLGDRKPHGADDLYKSDRVGRKGALSGGAANVLKHSIRSNQGKLGPKGTLPEADMEEGNEFSGELAKAKAQHKDSFEVDGKTYPVQEGDACPTCKSEPCACEDTEAADRELAKLKENCGIVSPIGSMAQDMQQQQGKISVNTSQSSDGTKNINISADGEAADQLMQILKMAGMAGAHQHQHAEVVVAAEPMEAKEYGNTDIDKPEEVLNTPRPDVRGMHRAETAGYADTTDDLNKQKDQDPETANKAANPKAAKVNRVEESHPLEALGAKLMAEYQAIKLTK